jgi:hypothetical protein
MAVCGVRGGCTCACACEERPWRPRRNQQQTRLNQPITFTPVVAAQQWRHAARGLPDARARGGGGFSGGASPPPRRALPRLRSARRSSDGAGAGGCACSAPRAAGALAERASSRERSAVTLSSSVLLLCKCAGCGGGAGPGSASGSMRVSERKGAMPRLRRGHARQPRFAATAPAGPTHRASEREGRCRRDAGGAAAQEVAATASCTVAAQIWRASVACGA